jgi:electron-transferring-flavoprotein dehydrogenase
VASYKDAWRSSPIGYDLKRVRNVKPLWSKYGTTAGVALGGLDMWLTEIFGWSPFGTMSHGKPDHECLLPLSQVKPIRYDKPDGVLTFDRLSSVFLSQAIRATKTALNMMLRRMLDQLSRKHSVLETKTYLTNDHRGAITVTHDKHLPQFTGT